LPAPGICASRARFLSKPPVGEVRQHLAGGLLKILGCDRAFRQPVARCAQSRRQPALVHDDPQDPNARAASGPGLTRAEGAGACDARHAFKAEVTPFGKPRPRGFFGALLVC
jgi:hypothetical protein